MSQQELMSFSSESDRQETVPQLVLNEVEKLRSEIHHHSHLYYDLEQPEITDAQYDALYKRLEAIEQQYPSLVIPSSPTQRVGGKSVDNFEQVVHPVPMLSISNAFSPEELREFDKRVRTWLNDYVLSQKAQGADEESLSHLTDVRYVVELKIDGLALKILYKDHHYVLAATRGNGKVGEDVTFNVATIRQIPQKLPSWAPKDLEVRGEVYISWEDFQRINAELPLAKQKSNPRNLASGSLRQKDSTLASLRNMSFFAYSMETKVPGVDNHWQALDYLEKLRFSVCPEREVFDNIEDVISACLKWHTKRHTLGYEIDGVVVKVDNFKARAVLGSVAHAPRWVIAYKLPSTQVLTVVRDIVVQVGRTGALTPVALFDPITADGSVISRASLHNEDEVKRKDVRVGDSVFVHKAALVIPEVLSVVLSKRPADSQPFVMPSLCPVCNQPVIKDQASVRCTNPLCLGRAQNTLEYFCSKNAMQIEGIGEKLIEQLLDTGLVNDIADIYSLTLDDLTQLKGAKVAAKIMGEIENSKKRPFEYLLAGLGIPNVGIIAAQALAKKFRSLEKLKIASLEDVSSIYGIGEEMAKEVVSYFAKPQTTKLLERLEKAGLTLALDDSADTLLPQKDHLKGMTFVVTGTLSDYTRDQAEELLRSCGAKATSSVSKNTTYLVAGVNAGSKLKKAVELGIPVIDQEKMLELVKGNSQQ